MSHRPRPHRPLPHRLRAGRPGPLPCRTRLTAALVVGSAALALLGGGSPPARAYAGPAAPAPAVGAPACQPGLGIGLVDTAPGADPRTRTYVVAHVHPGATFSRRFQVCNGTSGPLTIALYPAAATIGAGAFTVPTGRTRNDLSSWITLDQSRGALAAGQRLIATATFRVPADAARGERYAALLAELPPTPGGGGMRVVDRTGLRVYLDVGPGGDPASDFTVDALQATRDGRGVGHVLAEVRNTGARALDVRGVLDLTGGPGSQGAGPFPARLGTTIAPHTSEPVDITLSAAVRGGPWTAELTLSSGDLTRRVHAVVSFPEAGNSRAAAVPARPTPSGRHRGWLAGLVVALLLLVLALLLWLRRHRHRHRRTDLPPTPAGPLPARAAPTASG